MSQNVIFNNGYKCPAIGLGTARSNGSEVYAAVQCALESGYHHIDCAHLYRNEKDVGRAITDKIKDGTVKRSDLFVAGKLWNSFHRTDMVRPALEKTLDDLNLDYLDLYLIHWPMAFKDGWELNLFGDDGRVPYSTAEFTDTWKAMETLVDEGRVRSIGVSNFNKDQIERLLRIADTRPVTNQVECHPYFNQERLLQFCSSKGITLTAYRPLGLASDSNSPIHDPLVKDVAQKYGKTPAQVMIRFQLQRGVIVIPKSTNPERIKSNIDVFNFELNHEDMESLTKLDRGKLGRQLDVPYAKDHWNYPFHAEF